MGIHEGHRDRMKQEFLQGGLAHVSEPRVLELLLFYSRFQGDVNPLAHRLLAPARHVDKTYRVLLDTLGRERTKVVFSNQTWEGMHPNTLDFSAFHQDIEIGSLRVESIGGGDIRIPGETGQGPSEEV